MFDIIIYIKNLIIENTSIKKSAVDIITLIIIEYLKKVTFDCF